MPVCKGITKSGRNCKLKSTLNGYCKWHTEAHECIVCLDSVNKALPCGHWIHSECIQKHADAMQELRSIEGYPPLKEAVCSVCRAPVPGIIPKDPPITAEINISEHILQEVYTYYMANNYNNDLTLAFLIWVELCVLYPNYHAPDLLIIAAQSFAELIFNGSIPIIVPLDTRFAERLQREW